MNTKTVDQGPPPMPYKDASHDHIAHQVADSSAPSDRWEAGLAQTLDPRVHGAKSLRHPVHP